MKLLCALTVIAFLHMNWVHTSKNNIRIILVTVKFKVKRLRFTAQGLKFDY